VLVAAVGGQPVAALPLHRGPAIADPFCRTKDLVCVLELRIAQMRGRPSPGRRARSIVALRPGARDSGELATRA
jgi:hypothetical protein